MSSLLLLSMLALGAAASEDAGDVGRLRLPEVTEAASPPLQSVLERRRSVRGWGRAQLTRTQAARLLWAGQGVTAGDGRRTAPSAGALYPLELLLLAARVEGVPAGTWRYRPDAHALDLVAAGDPLPALAGLVQDFVLEAPAVIVVAAVPKRTAVKYGSRAERYVFIEVGCAAQNVMLEAVALGLGSTPVGAFDDAGVHRAAGLASGELPALLLPVGRPGR